MAIDDETRWVGQPIAAGAREKQREETRRKLYDAALSVFRRDGVANARIEDIVKLAGVSRGTFYFHYPTKEDVLVELLHGVDQQVANAVRALPEDAGVLDVFGTVARTIAMQWEGDPKIFPEVGMVAMRIVASGGMTTDKDPLRAALYERFAVAAARGELNSTVPPTVLSDFYLASVFAGGLGWAGAPTLPMEFVLTEVSKLFLYGARGPAIEMPEGR